MARRVGANRRGKIRQRRKAAKAKVRTHGRRAAFGLVWLAAAVLVVVGGWTGLRKLERWARASEHFVVKRIEVVGNSRIAREQVVQMAGLTPGMKAFDIDPGAVQASLTGNALVELVRVRRWTPGKVTVQIRERTPIALVNVGRVYQVDEQGVLFELPSGTYLSLPVVTGLTDTVAGDGLRRLTPAALEKLQRFRRDMASSDKAWYLHVSQVAFTPQGRVRLTLDGYPAAIEIDDQDITRRMNQLRRLLEVLAEEDGGSVNSISFSRHNIAYVRR
ncbi:MAG: FtsQ-type POTRA domain-containing protein [Chitinivibrionales bacterium]|nr:FtsQ-type POTRA domain-containing protein [Chitinivibrionales bacterium]